MPVIIDGHNLLWFVGGSDSGEPLTEVKLCHIINRYLRFVSEKGVIVFDGTGSGQKQLFDGFSNLEVVFSGANKEADAVIEDKVKASSAARHLTVVSTDRRIRSAAKAAGSSSLTSRAFWRLVQEKLGRAGSQPGEPAEKRGGLTTSETEQWLKAFGIE